MSLVKPRMAVAYHYWNHRDIELEIFERVRKTYDGPLAKRKGSVTKENDCDLSPPPFPLPQTPVI
jgi:hypothetical protein